MATKVSRGLEKEKGKVQLPQEAATTHGPEEPEGEGPSARFAAPGTEHPGRNPESPFTSHCGHLRGHGSCRQRQKPGKWGFSSPLSVCSPPTEAN